MKRVQMGPLWSGVAVGIAVLFLATPPVQAQEATAAQGDFASPTEGVAALVAATRAGRTAELVRILGPDGKALVYSGDAVADREGREQFVAAYDAGNQITQDGDTRAVLVVGKNDWPFPIPLVKQASAWRFDTAEGAQEILYRRIGRNELSAIEVCRAYVDAQHDYASSEASGSGFADYAQKFVSSPGKHDGLYWPSGDAETVSPMGPLIASARAEGYDATAGQAAAMDGREPYHGYFYRILTRQGHAAPGGAYDYVVDGRMVGGFALIAFPAKYGDSGVMSFMVNQDGAVYEKNLGPDGATIARRFTAFNPDSTWSRVP